MERIEIDTEVPTQGMDVENMEENTVDANTETFAAETDTGLPEETAAP